MLKSIRDDCFANTKKLIHEILHFTFLHRLPGCMKDYVPWCNRAQQIIFSAGLNIVYFEHLATPS